jgi:hypothetical protein
MRAADGNRCETHRQRASFAFGRVADPPQRRRRASEQLQERLVEATDAVEARGHIHHRNFH